jgi:hypothetical protein
MEEKKEEQSQCFTLLRLSAKTAETQKVSTLLSGRIPIDGGHQSRKCGLCSGDIILGTMIWETLAGAVHADRLIFRLCGDRKEKDITQQKEEHEQRSGTFILKRILTGESLPPGGRSIAFTVNEEDGPAVYTGRLFHTETHGFALKISIRPGLDLLLDVGDKFMDLVSIERSMELLFRRLDLHGKSISLKV